MPIPLAILPLKPFDLAKERLDLPAALRADLAAETAAAVAAACTGAGLDLAVVTADPAVAAWGRRRGARVIDDPGTGLNGAAAAGRAMAADEGRPWLVVHGDLPLLAVGDLAGIPAALEAGITVLAPSRDGGTKLLGSSRPLGFRYGPGSFVRHLAVAAPYPHLVVIRTGIAVEIDTVADLRTAAGLADGAWLRRFLPALPGRRWK